MPWPIASSIVVTSDADALLSSDRTVARGRRIDLVEEVRNNQTIVMPRRSTFNRVEAIGRTLPDVEVTTTWGQPTLKVRGRMLACMASHKSAEPDTLVVMMDFADRDTLVEDDPGTYYLKEHYVNYPCVLVRLSRVHTDALRDLIVGAHRYVSAKHRSRSRAR